MVRSPGGQRAAGHPAGPVHTDTNPNPTALYRSARERTGAPDHRTPASMRHAGPSPHGHEPRCAAILLVTVADHLSAIDPRNSTPVARRGRKATGLSESAGLPNGARSMFLGWNALGRRGRHARRAAPRPTDALRDWLATGIMGLGAGRPGHSDHDATCPRRASRPARASSPSWANAGTVRGLLRDEPQIKYSGRWTRADHPGHMGGHVRFSNQRNAKAIPDLQGVGVSWIGPVGSDPRQGQRLHRRQAREDRQHLCSHPSRRHGCCSRSEWPSVGHHRITIERARHRSPPDRRDRFPRRPDPQRARPPRTKPKTEPPRPSRRPTNAPQGTPTVLLAPDAGPAGTKTTLSPVRVRRRLDRPDRLRWLHRQGCRPTRQLRTAPPR